MIFYNGKLCSLVFRYRDFVGNAHFKFSVIRGFTIQTTLTYRKKIHYDSIWFTIVHFYGKTLVLLDRKLLLVTLVHARDWRCRIFRNILQEDDVFTTLTKCSLSNYATNGTHYTNFMLCKKSMITSLRIRELFPVYWRRFLSVELAMQIKLQRRSSRDASLGHPPNAWQFL